MPARSGVALPGSRLPVAQAVADYMAAHPAPKGDKGDQGPPGAKGDSGVAGATGPVGPQGVAGNAGPGGVKGDKGDAGTAGTQGAVGPQGNQGLPGATLLGTVTISQTATVAISAGWRKVTVSVPAGHGLTTGAPVILLPNGPIDSGYTVATNPYAASATSLEVMVQAPLLAIGTSYSFAFKLVKLNV